MSAALAKLLDLAQDEDGRRRHDDARAESVRALRLLEQRLRAALQGPLRGCASLVPPSKEPLYAVRVHHGPSHGHGIDTWLPEDGREVLVVLRSGEFAFARQTGVGASHRPARDEELAPRDLEPATRAVCAALGRHVAQLARSRESNGRAIELARRLSAALRP